MSTEWPSFLNDPSGKEIPQIQRQQLMIRKQLKALDCSGKAKLHPFLQAVQ